MKDGIIRNHTRKSRQTKITPEISQLICTIIKKNPFFTLGDLRRIVFRKYQTKLSEPTISKILRRFKIHRKRVRRVVVKNSNYLRQLKEKRKRFLENIQKFDENIIISIDETGFHKQMGPKYGYCESSSRLVKPTSSQRHTNHTVLAAVSNKKILAYQIMKGSCNKERYVAFLKNILIPKLTGNKYVLLADNLSYHHSKIVKNLVQNSNGKCIYTPPYSPDNNPIENVFSVIKSKVRKLNAWTQHEMCESIHNAFENFDCCFLKRMFRRSFGYNDNIRIIQDRIACLKS
jgi:transposase